MRLEGKVAVITGGSKGIGFGCARVFGRYGCTVVIGQAEAPRYVTAKAGQIGLTKALALDLAPKGVRVNAVCPAGVRTPLLEEWLDGHSDPQAAWDTENRIHPIERVATMDEIGEVCAFLASDCASFITGQAICPDGGAALGFRH